VLPHRPRPLGVHRGVDPAGERVLPRPTQPLGEPWLDVIRVVDRFDREARLRGAHHGGQGRRVHARGPGGVGRGTMTAPTAASPPPRGAVAGRYRLDRVLGRGAMGAVWEAEDTVLRRPVAVKEVILPQGLSPAERAVACERTLREARAIAKLAHPNV